MFSPQDHIVQENIEQELSQLGFSIEKSNAQSLASFLNDHFANFDIFSFVVKIDGILGSHCLKSANKKVIIQYEPPRLKISYVEDGLRVAFERSFIKQNGEVDVYHEFFSLPKSSQNRGIAREVLKVSIQQYVNVKANKIFLNAGLDNGGYTWAKCHFYATNRKEVEKILSKAENMLEPAQFNPIKRIFDNHYAKHSTGSPFPMIKWAEVPYMESVLIGTNWAGVLDLRNTQQFSNFIDYVLRR
ncbi:MAG: hypothetical protein ABW007_02345 [Chitinophagaceae bacterium]